MLRSCQTMRSNNKFVAALVLLCTLFSLGLVFSLSPLRDHLRDLTEVFRTYATFGLLKLEVYTYPPTEEEAERAKHSPKLAPKILHQIILQEGRNSSFAKYDSARESCISFHPDWEYMLWTDNNATAFVMINYPDVVPHYFHYAQTIQRTNVLRYLLLYHYGGVYLDVDITCLVPLDTLLHLPFVTPGAHPAGINNAFILARPDHPFLRGPKSRIPSRNIRWPLPCVENMLSTGCMFITNAWMEYTRSNKALDLNDKVYVLADENRTLESHMLRGATTTPLFEHGGASSWHSWDAELIVFIGAYWRKIIVVVVFMVPILGGAVIAYAVRKSAGRSHRRRRSGQDQEKAVEEKTHSH
jgi:mannosyltransferase OCH1-like enzyme